MRARSFARWMVGVVAAGTGTLSVPTALAQEPAVTTVRIAQGLTQPLYVASAPGDSSRIFVVERTGKIKVIQLGPTPTVLATPLLDVGSLIQTSWLEYGLLSVVFHPNFVNNGYFYVNYTPSGSTNADSHIVRYRVPAATPNVADPASATTILRFSYTRQQHRAGWMGFGPDGYLYITTGDGGEGDPDNAAQTVAASSPLSLRGKVLRIDVNGPDGVPGTSDDDQYPGDANKSYVIPASNPFVIDPGTPARAPEIWAYGLRNPWRASFDRLTGDLWIGDVGQSMREEVDRAPAGAAGLNFGWRCTEGNACPGLAGCTCNAPTLTPPIYDYGRTVGVCVTGGYVYRGCAYPALRGTYFFAEYQLNKAWSFRHVVGAPNNGVTAFTDRFAQLQGGGAVGGIAAFGEDANGEIYVCDYGGELYKIVPPAAAVIDRNGNGVPDACEFCTADLDDGTGRGTPNGGVTIEDLIFFLGMFEQGSVRIDIDNGSKQGIPDAAVTIDDLIYYLVRFEAGC